MSSKNLGIVSGVFIGKTPPTNIAQIWFDDTPSEQVHKVYNKALKQWVVLDQNIISAITYSELVNVAKGVGLTVGQWFKITDKSNALALAITSTKVQYSDILGNILIDDLGTNVQYHVTSSNLLIDDVQGVFNIDSKKLVFVFSEAEPTSDSNTYLLGKKKEENAWKLVKFKISSFISSLTGNSISWRGGFFFNFYESLKNQFDKKGGVVSNDKYQKDKEQINQSITNVGKDNQKIIEGAKKEVEKATTSDAIYSKQLPSIDPNGQPIDIKEGDSLSALISKIQRWIKRLRIANGIRLSSNFSFISQKRIVNNNDTVESAFSKIMGYLFTHDFSKNIKLSDREIQSLTNKPDPIKKDDSILDAINKLYYLATHVDNLQIVDRSITFDKLAIGTFYTDIFRVDMKLNYDMSGSAIGGCVVAGEDTGFFRYDSEKPNNPYRIDNSYMHGKKNLPIIAFAPVTRVVTNNENEFSIASPCMHYTGMMTKDSWGQIRKEGMNLQVQIYLSQERYDYIYGQGNRYIKIEVKNIDIYDKVLTPSTAITYMELHRVNIFTQQILVNALSGTGKHIILGFELSFVKNK